MVNTTSKVRRIGVLTSGGDAPGMNPVVRSVVRTCLHLGIECVGIRRGFAGLLAGDIRPLDYDASSGLIRRGGTKLYTARCDEFKTEAGQKKGADTCKFLGLDGIVGIGGDGTFRGLQALSHQGISVVGVPGTIDNDIACSTYTVGFDTACNTAIEAIDRLQDTMQSHERCSVVEVMGRHAGYLALNVAVACGALAVLVPEKEVNFEEDILEPIRRSRLVGRTHFMIIVAEGAGSAYDVAKRIHEALSVDTRVTVLGHVQRGGSPSAQDRLVGTHLGYRAVQLLAEGKTNRVVCCNGEEYVDYDIEDALAMHKTIDESTYTMIQQITGTDALSRIMGLRV